MSASLQIRSLSFLNWGPLSFQVQPGECVGISGASGSGKSLLLRAIADLDPHEGEVVLNGTAASSIAAPSWRRRVAMLPAESRWWHDRVAEHFHGHDASHLVRDLGFNSGPGNDPGEDVMAWEIARLSVGERQRLALARLLCRDPEVLLLDEPTANLDAEATEAVERVVAARQLPTIWVSHDPEQIARVADRRFRMQNNSLEEQP